MKRTIAVILVALLAVAGLVVGPALQQRYRLWRLERKLAAESVETRIKALRRLARLRLGEADTLVLDRLFNSADPQLRAGAARAIWRARRCDLADHLRRALATESDGEVRSALVWYWIDLSGDKAAAAARRMLQSPDRWTRLGAATGLLWRGDPSAADVLFNLSLNKQHRLAGIAQRQLAYFASPLAEMIGQPLPVDAARAGAWSPREVELLRRWWTDHVTRRLLGDWLAWKRNKPEYWWLARLLQHEWDANAPGFLRSGPAAVRTR